MNHNVLRMLACMVAGCLPLATHAAPAFLVDPPEPVRQGWFLGAGVGAVEIREPGVPNDVLTFAYLQGGWRFNRYLSLDARLGMNAVAVEYDLFPDEPANLRVKNLYGLYGRATLPVGKRWDLFALVGYTSLKLTAETGSVAASDTTNSVSYGVGASWEWRSNLAIDLEYLPSLTGGGGVHTNTTNLAFRVRF
jgi:opacity protein-like surface antigen